MKKFYFLTAALTVLFLAGCGEGSADDPRLILAEKCREEGDFRAAERQLRRYWTAHPEDAAIHLKLASIYDESMKDPLGAAYHYREYLRLEPDSPQKASVQAWLDAACRKCAGITGKETENNAENEAEVKRLTRENTSLRQLALRQQQELAKLRRPAGVPAAAQKNTVPPPQPAAAPADRGEKMPAAPAGFYEHTIKQGDTLGRIARHYYGSSQKIGPILEANTLTPRSVLHIGQKLKIPKQTGVK